MLSNQSYQPTKIILKMPMNQVTDVRTSKLEVLFCKKVTGYHHEEFCKLAKFIAKELAFDCYCFLISVYH
jgi:hypothetical protein